jgi:5-methylcytosine-specific restriction endonuclease McrA
MAHSKEYVKIMNSQRWHNLQSETLRKHPYCERCEAMGRQTKAKVVHHIKPIESGHSIDEYESLAYNPENLQALCTKCHSYIHRKELDSLSREGRKRRAHDRLQRWFNDIRAKSCVDGS